MNKFYGYIISFILLGLLICCNYSHQYKNQSEFQNIDLFAIIYNKRLISFQIDSDGNVLELENSKDFIKISSYVLSRAELDSLNGYIKRGHKFRDSIQTNNNDCVDGVYYKLTIKNNDQKQDIENTICHRKTIADKMILFILTISDYKSKELLFKNYLRYDKFQRGFDSILNHNK